MNRALSIWGWGYADRHPDSAGRRAIGEQVGAMLGFTGLQPLDVPTLDDLALPAPRTPVPADLASLAQVDPYSRATHTRGKAYPDLIAGLRRDYATAPDWVATPTDEQGVARILEVAAERDLAVVPFGGGTSVVGGVECAGAGHRGVVSLDLRGLDRVLEVDEVSRLARIQAGATGPQLSDQLAAHGLTLRHYPQSFEFSTLGGWIATRAGGHFATLYTHIDDLVASTRMITPSGTWASRPLPGSGAGPSPDRLALGSEGILGVITEAWMRVRPIPRWRASATVEFTDFPDAVAATREVAQAGLFPSNCRLLDKREARLHGVSLSGRHLLLLGFESAHHPVGDLLTLAIAAAQAHGGTCPEGPRIVDKGEKTAHAGQAGSWRQAFLEAPYLASTLATLGVMADTFETACTWSRFEALHADVVSSVRDVMKRTGGGGFLACRFTHVYPDGPAPYYTFVTPAQRGGEVAQWLAIKTAASDALMRHQATITHHHAVGRTHRPWYDQQRPALFADALRAAKRTLDPHGILNPGVLIDP